MLVCKPCKSDSVVKNGILRSTQRYRCKVCKYNFIALDKPVKENLKAKRALAVLLYGLGKPSYSMLGKIFGLDRSLIYPWIKQAAAKLPYPTISNHIKEIEFDEMWHFVGRKKQKMEHQSLGSSYKKTSWLGYWKAR
jgi:transposase